MREHLQIQLLTPCIVLLAMTLGGCASSSKSLYDSPLNAPEALPYQPVSSSDLESNTCSKWVLPLRAHVSHVSTSDDGKRILVSTSAERGRYYARIRLINDKKKTLWSRGLRQPVKAQAISPNGNLLAVNSYDGKLSIYNARGKLLWQRTHLGRPMILPKRKRILLFNDDDSEPGIVFLSYDFTGKLKHAVLNKTPGQHPEPIDLVVANDESYVVAIMADSSVRAYTPDGKPLWQSQFEKHTVNVFATGGARPAVYALSATASGDPVQWLTAYTIESSKKVSTAWRVSMERRYESLRVSNGVIFLYGNSQNGQALAAFSTENGKERWRYSYSSPGTYSSLVYENVLEEPYFTAMIDEGKKAGVLRAIAVTASGKALWNAPIPASDGVFSYALAKRAHALAVGAGAPGNGKLIYFTRQRGRCGAGGP